MPNEIEMQEETLVIDQEAFDSAQDFTPAPDGRYLCICNGVMTKASNGGPRMTKDGTKKWTLVFSIIENPNNAVAKQCGKRIMDDLMLSPKAQEKRVPYICGRMGYKPENGQLSSSGFVGKMVWLDIFVDSYVNDAGEEKHINRVGKAKDDNSWDVYHRFDEAAEPGNGDVTEKDMPF
jgi:hypothetical protein